MLFTMISAPANNSTNYCTRALHNRRREIRYYQSPLLYFFVLNIGRTNYIQSFEIWQVECPYYYDCPLLVFGLSIINVVVLINANVVLLH